MKSRFLFGALLAFPFAFGCDNIQPPPVQGTVSGNQAGDGGIEACSPSPIVPCGSDVVLGDPGLNMVNAGNAYSWAKIDSAGKPTEYSYSVPLSAFSAMANSTNDLDFWIKVPSVVTSQTVLTGLRLNYAAHGHAPTGVYDTKHLDIHVWIKQRADAEAIDCTDQTLPPADMIPTKWLMATPDNCLQQHGIPAVNLFAPEFNQQRFVTGMMLTFYKGTFYSWEPKLTLEAILERQETFNFPLLSVAADPNKTMPDGMYPTKMTVKYDKKTDTYVFTIGTFKPGPITSDD